MVDLQQDDHSPAMDLVRLAVRMRRRQISYFGSRNSHALMAAKELEQQFDNAARALLGDAGEVRQPAEVRRLV
jgi:hypothetical protein